jgi:hypothetical protein
MMFRIDEDVMRVLFTFGDRDLALALADMEGFVVVGWGKGRMDPSPVVFNEAPGSHGRMLGTQPEQVSPGVYSYKIARKKRATYAQGIRLKKGSSSATCVSTGASDA